MKISPFRDRGIPGREAIVVILDLEGFSNFLTQPDVHMHAPSLLNHIFASLQEWFSPGRPSWFPRGVQKGRDDLSIPEPTFAKFLGDGAIFLWVAESDEEVLDANLRSRVMACFWSYKNAFREILSGATDELPITELPKSIRFGIARGTVYGLCAPGSKTPIDYIGHCINLAARLQGYCKDLGFIASARITMKASDAEKRGWKKVLAKELRGMKPELVWVDESEFDDLPAPLRAKLFDDPQPQ